MKPCKGEIHNWKRIYHPLLTEGLGYKIFGKPVGHPTIVNWILTSEVVDQNGSIVETLNSTYRLVGEEYNNDIIRINRTDDAAKSNGIGEQNDESH